MSRQFNFLAFPHEMDVLWPVMAAKGACVFRERDILADPPRIQLIDLAFARAQDLCSYRVFITFPALLRDVVIESTGECRRFWVNQSVSPTIEFCLPDEPQKIPENGIIHNARLYYLRGYDGREGWVAYPADLDELYEALVKALKKQVLKRVKVYHINRYLSNDALKRWPVEGA